MSSQSRSVWVAWVAATIIGLFLAWAVLVGTSALLVLLISPYVLEIAATPWFYLFVQWIGAAALPGALGGSALVSGQAVLLLRYRRSLGVRWLLAGAISGLIGLPAVRAAGEDIGVSLLLCLMLLSSLQALVLRSAVPRTEQWWLSIVASLLIGYVLITTPQSLGIGSANDVVIMCLLFGLYAIISATQLKPIQVAQV